MWLSRMWLLFLIGVILSSCHAFLLLEEESGTALKCELICESGDRFVCGDDGRTYNSRCDIRKAKCQGQPVQIKHQGKCVGKGRCMIQRALMLEQASKRAVFVPECKEDGSYAEVQCHSFYCWCVDEYGKPIRGTSIENGRPNCAIKKTRTTKRRSSRGRKSRKGCSNVDRANFNANLIDIFQSEYNRILHPTNRTPTASDPLRDTQQKQVIQWKFDQLDDNGDSYLKKRELRHLRRMAKKIVKPKVCAKTFAKFCDLDQDKRISRSEWSVCVGIDINNEQVNGVEDFLDDAPKEEDDLDNSSSPSQLAVKTESWEEQHFLRNDDLTPTSDSDSTEEQQDCTGARRVALENHRQNPEAGTYIPECTPDGLYVKAQCHRSNKYCWCVHSRTGRPIKGTATQGIKPDCEAPRRGTKNFKGCPLHKKQEFLDELVQSFTKEMLEDAKNRSVNIEIPTSEKAARWKFAVVDVNDNNVLDKREWKVFKKERKAFQKDSKQRKRLRKCWRNLPRFCDENDDHKLSIDEWLSCTGIMRDFKSTLPLNQSRRGKNPFSSILKSD